MKRMLPPAIFVALVAASGSAWSCGGPAAMSVAVSCDPNQCMATNVGQAPISITFDAWTTSYSLTLIPGQTGTPQPNGWIFPQPMKGYRSCTAIFMPAR